MRHSLRKLYSAVLLLAVIIAAIPSPSAAVTWKESWSPTVYKDNALNAQTFCTLTAEYPVYRTGTVELHLILANKADELLGYGLAYVLERRQADGWYAQSLVDAQGTPMMWPMIGLIAPRKSAWGISISFSVPLQPGEYRIIKGFGREKPGSPEYPFAAYFKVADNGYDSARLSGLAPMNTLPAQYTAAQAIADGAVYQDTNGKLFNKDRLTAFLAKVRQGVPAKVRLLSGDTAGNPVLSDVSYIGKGVKAFYRFFLEQRPLFPVGQPSKVTQSYYPFLISYQKDGAYGLFLSERNTTIIKTTGANEWPLLNAIRRADRKEIMALLKGPVSNPIDLEYRTDPEYRVYDASGSSYAYLYFDREEQTVCYKLQDGKNSDVDLSPLEDKLKELLDIEWKTQYALLLTYRTAEGKRCTITYDTRTDQITGIALQVAPIP